VDRPSNSAVNSGETTRPPWKSKPESAGMSNCVGAPSIAHAASGSPSTSASDGQPTSSKRPVAIWVRRACPRQTHASTMPARNAQPAAAQAMCSAGQAKRNPRWLTNSQPPTSIDAFTDGSSSVKMPYQTKSCSSSGTLRITST
jgi:hypothetical protein